MWLFNENVIESIEDLPEGAHGFIYCTTYLPTQQKYIGKKSLIYKTKKKLGKKEKALWEGRGRPPSIKIVEKESDWLEYYGSHELIKEQIKKGNQQQFQREILQFAYSKRELTYLECKYQFSLGVLETDDYLNTNILGKFMASDLGF